MEQFSSYKLINNENGHDVVLYLNESLEEFADELIGSKGKKNEHIIIEAKRYLGKVLPNLRINTVKIMYGSLIVSYITLNGMSVSAAAATKTTTITKNISYTVKRGDTLYAIAKKYKVSVDQIKKANNLRSSIILVGRKLKVPTKVIKKAPVVKPPVPKVSKPAVSAPKTTAPVTAYYTVKRGDTLSSIAKKNNVTVDNLKKANKLTTNTIIIGKKLVIPKVVSTPAKPAVSVPQSPAPVTSVEDSVIINSHYIVKPGDSLWSIANNNNVTVEEIKALNNLTSNTLYVNQRLFLPITVQVANASVYRAYTNLAAMHKDTTSPVVYDFTRPGSNSWLPATVEQVAFYINPYNFIDDAYGKYQFLVLNYTAGITAEDINILLKGKGVLQGKGDVFLAAAKANNISPIYLVSHALLETGEGTSTLAKGVSVTEVNGKAVTSKRVYNMFGIAAYDISPDKYGSEYAYTQQWFSVDAAINGGANWISGRYINHPIYKQNTLYKMRWNPDTPGVHQYSTDVSWAYNQTYNMKALIDKLPNAELIFDISQ